VEADLIGIGFTNVHSQLKTAFSASPDCTLVRSSAPCTNCQLL
jgi:hypothetical protein